MLNRNSVNDADVIKFMGMLTVLIAALNVTGGSGYSNMVVVFAIVGIVCFFYQKVCTFSVALKEMLIILIYSLFLSLAIIIGDQVHYVTMRSSMRENYISLNYSVIFTGLSLTILIFPIIVVIIEMIKKYTIIDATETKQFNWKFFFISWGIIWFAWMPYLLTFYPAGIVGDGACTLELSLQDGIPGHNHWGVFIY